MDKFIELHAGKIKGSLSCFDRVLFRGYLPIMSGAEVTRRIRSGGVAGCRPDLPIVALTAFALPGDRERFLAMGMNDYIQKPINIDAVLTCLQQVLGR